jgi:phage gp29-like protein
MAGPSLFRRLADAWRRPPAPAAVAELAPRAQGEIRSTPASDNPYPRRRTILSLAAGTGKDLPVYSWTEWDSVSKVKAALSELEGGHFMQAAQLVDAMGRDDRIAGVLATRVNGLFGLPVDFEDKHGTKRAAKPLEELRPKMFPKAQTKKLLRSGIMLGVGLAENVWERTATSWTPRLKWWHPQFLQWRWDTRSFWVQTMTGQVEITPGDGQWVLYTPHGAQLGWLEAMVRALAIPWLIRQWARRDWARYSEVHGLPIRLGKVPAKADNDDKERFIDELSQLASENTIRLPQGETPEASFDVDLLEAVSQSWEGFQALIAKTDVDIAVTLIGQNLTTEAGTGVKGALATAQVHERVRQDVLEDDATSLDECLHEQSVKPWALYNYGDEDAAPMATIHTDPPEDLKGKADVFKTVGEALKNYRDLKVPVNVQQVMTDFAVPIEEGGEMPDLTEGPPPAQQDPNAKPGAKPGDPPASET